LKKGCAGAVGQPAARDAGDAEYLCDLIISQGFGELQIDRLCPRCRSFITGEVLQFFAPAMGERRFVELKNMVAAGGHAEIVHADTTLARTHPQHEEA